MTLRPSTIVFIVLIWGFASDLQASNAASDGRALPTSGSNHDVDAFMGDFTTGVTFEVPPHYGIEPRLGLVYRASAGAGDAGMGVSLAGLPSIERRSPGKGVPSFTDEAEAIRGLSGEYFDNNNFTAYKFRRIDPQVNYWWGRGTPDSRLVADYFAVRWTGWIKVDFSQTYTFFITVDDWGRLTIDGQTVVESSAAQVERQGVISLNAGWHPITFEMAEYHGEAQAILKWSSASVGKAAVPASHLSPYRRDTPDDVLSLDGVPLIECADAPSSPGCLHGGTHASRIEDYQRITQDVVTNTWRVVNPTGVVATYAAIEGPDIADPQATVRWSLSRTTDLHGNVVDYDYDCVPLADESCVLRAVHYNGVDVTLAWQPRARAERRAAGYRIDNQGQRLVSVRIDVGGELARAYAMGYQPSALTGRDLLTTVQQFGRDAVIDASGEVLSGTALPPTRFGYEDAPVAWAVERSGPSVVVRTATAEARVDLGRAHYADFDGDGRTDIGWISGSGTASFDVHLAQPDGSFSFAPSGLSLNVSSTTALAQVDVKRLLVGDFNGDGTADLARVEGWGATTPMSIFMGMGDGSFAAPVLGPSVWVTGTNDTSWAEVDVQRLLVGDFNGDGLDDLMRVNGKGGWAPSSLFVSSGDGTFSELEGPRFVVGESWDRAEADLARLKLGDINGDGRTDIVHIVAEGGSVPCEVYVAGAAGDFRAAVAGPTFTVAAATAAYDLAGIRLADFNGDGASDLIQITRNTSTPVRLYASRGDGRFDSATDGPNLAIANETDLQRVVLLDLNDDGAIDFGRINGWGSSQAMTVHLMQPDGSTLSIVDGPAFFVRSTAETAEIDLQRVAAADFDGDGRVDLVHVGSSGALEAVRLMGQWDAPAADAMRRYDNRLGGWMEIAYAPSSRFENQILPSVLHVVEHTTVYDGRGGTSQTTYDYTGGLWDAVERRFLGFRQVRVTSPCTGVETSCPYSVTWFAQDYGSVAKPEQIDVFDGAGDLLSSTQHTYITNGDTPPFTSLNEATWRITYDGTGTHCETWPCAAAKRSRTTREHDIYANITASIDYGDFDFTGDEAFETSTFNPNGDAYIVSLPARTRTYAGTDATAALLTDVLVHYDGATSSEDPPIRGDATLSRVWHDVDSTYVETAQEYDASGNRIGTIDPLGHRTEVDYDPVYGRFPEETRLPLFFGAEADARFRATTTWDPVCGLPLTQTDINGRATQRRYDALCRLERIDTPGGGFTTTTYLDTGDPALQRVRVETPGTTPSDTLWSESFVDGWGRVIETRTEGPAPGREIVTSTNYDARGQVASQTAPHYAGETPYVTTHDYDALDRRVRTTYPDGAFVRTSFELGPYFTMARFVDEMGRVGETHWDARGRTVESTRLDGNRAVSTAYTYDVLGRLRGITDAAGNVWSYTYDSLGRQLTASDPDLGDRTYDYDAAGRIIAATDALGQQTTLEHDAMGRLRVKTSRAGTAEAETTTFFYDEDVPGHFNTGRLTRAVAPGAETVTSYDVAGRLVHRAQVVGGVLYPQAWGYDTAGRPLWKTYPDGDQVADLQTPITYDGAGRMVSVPGVVDDITYDAAGRPEVITRPNGTVTSYQYSATRGWLESVDTVNGTTTLQSLMYERDASGGIDRVLSAFVNESWDYTYDGLKRLTEAMNTDDATFTQSFNYDDIDNVIFNSAVGAYEYPQTGTARPHAVSRAGADTFSYDLNGNLIAGGGRLIDYDGHDRPVDINGVIFTYDADGTRVSKSSANGATVYPSADVEINACQVTKYLPGGAKRTPSGTYWMHRDHLSSVQAVTDDQGAEVQRLVYRPYGERLSTASAHSQSLGYIGQRQDDETGLFYLNARYYDPVLGRFISGDPSSPVKAGVGTNRYAYAFNNPIALSDPSGLAVRSGTAYDREKAAREARKMSSSAAARGTHRSAQDYGLTEGFAVREMVRESYDFLRDLSSRSNDGVKFEDLIGDKSWSRNDFMNRFEQVRNQPRVWDRKFGSLRRAARATLEYLHDFSRILDRELAGFTYYDARGMARVTAPVIGNQGFLTPGYPPEGAMGFYHTHPGLGYSGLDDFAFSRWDYNYARDWGLAAYVSNTIAPLAAEGTFVVHSIPAGTVWSPNHPSGYTGPTQMLGGPTSVPDYHTTPMTGADYLP